MRYHVSGKFTIDFDDYIDVPDNGAKQMESDGTLKDHLRGEFWRNVDHCILPDFGVMMGEMNLSDMQYKQVEQGE